MSRALRLALTAALTLLPLGAAAFDAKRPAVVELFTSQGCSACPPANAAVAALADRPDVLALTFGVTFWDELGWKDTFAHPAFTNRQRVYGRLLDGGRTYTPEVVVEGRTHFPGQSRAAIEKTIAGYGRRDGPDLTLSVDRVAVPEGRAPEGGARVWLVRYDPRTVQVPVKRGENAGRTLPHRNVVKELVPLGRWTGQAASYPLPAPAAPGLRTAVLLQADDGRILSAVRS